jgi:hypothetical protein
MLGRFVATASIVLLAFGAFWIDAVGIGNSIAVVLVLVAAVTWFNWPIIEAAFRSVKDESDLPIIRLSSRIISGMRPAEPIRRSSNA